MTSQVSHKRGNDGGEEGVQEVRLLLIVGYLFIYMSVGLAAYEDYTYYI